MLSLSSAAVARAESRSTLRAVEVSLVGAIGKDATIAARVSSWFDPARFEVVVRAAPVLDASRVLEPRRDRALSVWVVVERGAAHLYFATPAAEGAEPRFLLRTLSLPSGLDEMGAERVAEVLHLSALALLEGEQRSERVELERSLGQDGAAFSRDESPGASPNERPPREALATESSPLFEFGLGYGLSLHSSEGVWHGPRARAALRIRRKWRGVLLLRSALPADHDLGEMELRVQALQLSLALGVQRSLSSSLRLEALLGPGLDGVHYRPVRFSTPGIEAGSGATELRPNLTSGLGLVLGQPPFQLALLTELELSFSKTRYVLALPSGRRVIAEPSPFIPHFAAEVRF